MPENADKLFEPSHSDQEDSPSVFLHSSKLVRSVPISRSHLTESSIHPLYQRNRLEKLAKWRIDPSLIEFPPDAREFRGGFATVSRGLLASLSRVKGGVNHTTDEPPNLDDGDPQFDNDTPERGTGARGEDGEADTRKADGDNDHPKEEGKKEPNNDDEQKSPRQPPIPKIEIEASISALTVDEDLGSADHNDQSHSNTKEDENDRQGKHERSASDIADGSDEEAKGQTKKESKDSTEGEKRDRLTSKKIVAVKKLKIETDADLKRVLGLALRESEFLTELSHPNIVKLEGFVEDLPEHKVWLIFSWEEHGNLRDFLASGEWEIPERISLIWDVTLGLEYLHIQEPPIYHGDLKSLNILVNSECHALITDFGSARHLEHDYAGKRSKNQEGPDKPEPATSDPTTIDEHITLEAIFSATASTLTLTGSSYTLRWAAPELLQDDKPCLGSDIWALGWIAYEVMTNTIPFHDIKKDAIVINHVIQGKLPSITEDARMSLIRALCSLMLRCWSINPAKRPTAEECRKLISWIPMIVPAPTQATTEEASQLRHAQLLNKLGNMYRVQADYAGALSSFTAALDIYTNHNDLMGRGETLLLLADVHRFRHYHNEAIKFYSEAQQILTDLGEEDGRGDALFGLASIHLLRDEYGEAAKLHKECLQIYTNTGSKRKRASALWGLAEVHRLQAEYSEAIDLYSEALQIYTEVGDLRERALTLCGLAALHRHQEEYNEAVNLYSEALQTYTDVGDHKERATTLFNLATVHWLQFRYNEARKLYSESLQIYTDIGDRRGRGTALLGLARVHSAVQEYDEATQLYPEALQIFIDIGDKHWRVDTLTGYAEMNEMQGHHREAASLYTEASEVLEEIGDSSRASDALERASDIRKTIEGDTADSAETVVAAEEPLFT